MLLHYILAAKSGQSQDLDASLPVTNMFSFKLYTVQKARLQTLLHLGITQNQNLKQGVVSTIVLHISVKETPSHNHAMKFSNGNHEHWLVKPHTRLGRKFLPKNCVVVFHIKYLRCILLKTFSLGKSKTTYLESSDK